LPGKYKTYSPEFRDEAARLVVETSRAIADAAREFGISETSLGRGDGRAERRGSRPGARGGGCGGAGYQSPFGPCLVVHPGGWVQVCGCVGLKVNEVASYEHSRIHGVSNLNTASDGWRVLRTILVERFHYSKKRSEHASAAGLPDRQPARELVSRSR
jgi:hypothetical protein